MRTSPKSIARMSLNNNNTIILADLRTDNCKKIRNSFIIRLTLPHLHQLFVLLTLSVDNTNNNKSDNNEQTKKESTSEKSGKREDGFEGRKRRTKKGGVVFEDS